MSKTKTIQKISPETNWNIFLDDDFADGATSLPIDKNGAQGISIRDISELEFYLKKIEELGIKEIGIGNNENLEFTISFLKEDIKDDGNFILEKKGACYLYRSMPLTRKRLGAK